MHRGATLIPNAKALQYNCNQVYVPRCIVAEHSSVNAETFERRNAVDAVPSAIARQCKASILSYSSQFYLDLEPQISDVAHLQAATAATVLYSCHWPSWLDLGKLEGQSCLRAAISLSVCSGLPTDILM